jgi:hypothetical protein
MCPSCVSVGVLALVGAVSTAGLSGLLLSLQAGRETKTSQPNPTPEEKSS